MKKTIALVSLALAAVTSAYAWPDKTVTLVVPFPPGGSSDALARAITPKLQEKFKQTVIVENKAGATGSIGAAFVKRAPADGYTLMVTSLGPLVITPHLLKVAYDAAKDFDYLTVAVQAPNVLVVPAASPFKTVADLIAAEKAKPGALTFASAGNGSSDHLSAELFWLQTGTSGLHVPYKGGAPAITDLLGSQVDAAFQNINSVIQHINAGKLRTLAIASDKRSPLLPNVPTLKELGIEGVEVDQWYAFFAPAKTPRDVVAKLNAALNQVLADKETIARIESHGADVEGSTPEQLAELVKSDLARWKRVVQQAKLQAD